MTRKLWLFPLLALVALVGVLAACNDDDDGSGNEEDIAAIEEMVQAVVETDPTDPEQVDFFIAHMTDEVMDSFFGTTKEDCAANAEDCIGEPTPVQGFDGTRASDSSGQTTVTTADGVFTVAVVQEEEDWLVNEIRFGPGEVPEGVKGVALEIMDYGYSFDEGDIEDGSIAFEFENVGEEPHEVTIAKINDEFDIDAAVEFWSSEAGQGGDLPTGVETVTFLGFAPPGGKGIGLPEEPLEAGKYTFICMVPDAEGTPHAALGMTKEFTVPD